jgi:hypothetical protein
MLETLKGARFVGEAADELRITRTNDLYSDDE